MLLLGSFVAFFEVFSSEKPSIAKPCTTPGCYTAKPQEIRGNLVSVLAKAKLI